MSEARVRRAGRGEATVWDRQLTKHRYRRAGLEIRFMGSPAVRDPSQSYSITSVTV